MVPAASWPSTTGGGSGIVPLVAERSLWQTPQAPILIITSPRFGDSTVIVSTTTGLFHSRQRTAFDCLAIWRMSPGFARRLGRLALLDWGCAAR